MAFSEYGSGAPAGPDGRRGPERLELSVRRAPTCSAPRTAALTLLTSLAVIAGFSHLGATRRVLGLQTGTVLRAVSGRTLLFGSTVTGGAGFLGYHLSAQLHLQRGGTQVVLLQPRPVRVLLAVAQAGSAGAVEALGVRVVVGDMCDTPLIPGERH